jgi:hypothetical protein
MICLKHGNDIKFKLKMNIYVKTSGRLGNNLIQYFFGKILSQNIESNLYTDINLPVEFGLENHYGVLNTEGYSTLTEVWKGYQCNLLLDNIEIKKDINSIIESIKINNIKNIVLSGYFQEINYYESYRNFILDKFNYKKIKSNSVGIHVRKGDIINSENDLPDSWFLEMAKKFKDKRRLITTDSPNHPLIKELLDIGCELYSENPEKTIIDFSGFEDLILSQGTFSWWMGFLSEGKKHVFLSKTGWIDNFEIYKFQDKNWIYYK